MSSSHSLSSEGCSHAMMPDMHELNQLTHVELMTVVRGHLSVLHAQRLKANLISFIMDKAPLEVLVKLKEMICAKQREDEVAGQVRRKRKRDPHDESEEVVCQKQLEMEERREVDLNAESLQQLTKDELMMAVRGRLHVPHGRSQKHLLIHHILECASLEVLCNLRNMLDEKIVRCNDGMDGDVANSRRWCRMTRDRDFNMFISIPSGEERRARWRSFYEATGREALSTGVCTVCGQELMKNKDHLVKMPWMDLPGKEKLRPTYVHPAQELFDGCLLAKPGIVQEEDGIHVWLCGRCLDQLNSSKEVPDFALANGLWIGDIPFELQGLTIAEQKLLALVYPCMHVYKLYPKVYCGEEGLQRAMRGSLSTYMLNAEKISDMINGRLMPRPMELLPSVIAVLYIGCGNLPKEPLKHLLRVRREKVKKALLWLKKNNLKYFGNIDVDEQQLSQLPEDDVPETLMAIVRRTEEESVIDEENGGYVREEEDIHGQNACMWDIGSFDSCCIIREAY